MLLAAVMPEDGKQSILGHIVNDSAVVYFNASTLLDFLFGIFVLQRTKKKSNVYFIEIDKNNGEDFWCNSLDTPYKVKKLSDIVHTDAKNFERDTSTVLYFIDHQVHPIASYNLSRYLFQENGMTLFNNLFDLYNTISDKYSSHWLIDLESPWITGCMAILDLYTAKQCNHWNYVDTKWTRSWIYNNYLLPQNDGTADLYTTFSSEEKEDVFLKVIAFINSRTHNIAYRDSDTIRLPEYAIWTMHFLKQGVEYSEAYRMARSKMEELVAGRLGFWKQNNLFVPFDSKFNQKSLKKLFYR